MAVTAGDPTLEAMILVAGRAGFRSGELRGLRWGDVDFKANVIHVRRNEYRGQYDTPKSGLTREVPMAARVADVLEALASKGDKQPDPATPLFTHAGGRRPLSEKAMTLRLLAAGVRAELPHALAQGERARAARRFAKARQRARRAGRQLSDKQKAAQATYKSGEAVRFGWHVLRHSFCSHLAMNGTPLLKIMQWAGHANVQTTQRYMHLAPAERQAAAAIGALDGRRPRKPLHLVR